MLRLNNAPQLAEPIYAVYNEARRLAQQLGLKEVQFDNHRVLIDFFANEPQREYKNIAINLRRLRKLRNDTDYKLRFARLDYQAQTSLTITTTLLDTITNLRQQERLPGA